MFVEVRGESLSVQVNVIKQDTVLVNWTVDHQLEQPQLQLQIVYSPVQVSYYIVHPILNPATEFVLLENLQPFTSYQLRMRSSNMTSLYLQTDTVYFSTSGSQFYENYYYLFIIIADKLYNRKYQSRKNSQGQ